MPAVRCAQFAATAIVIGAMFFRLVVRRALTAVGDPPLVSNADALARRAGLAGALVLLVASVARGALQIVTLAGDDDWRPMVSAVLLHTRWGHGWLVGVAGVIVLALAFSVPSWRAAAGIGGLAVAVSPALTGHAVASEGWTALAVAGDTLHVVAMSAWVGTLAMIVICLYPALRSVDAPVRAQALAHVIHGFSPLALSCAGVLVATGVFAACLHVESVSALWSSNYGRLVVAKVCAFLGVATAGAYNWRRVTPRLGTERGTAELRWSAIIELALAAVAVVITAWLVGTSPHAMT